MSDERFEDDGDISAPPRNGLLHAPIRLEIVCVLAIAVFFGWMAVSLLWECILWYSSDDAGLRGLVETGLLAALISGTISLVCARWLFRRWHRSQTTP